MSVYMVPYTIQGVFPPRAQCFQDSLWFHHDPDKVVTQYEWMKN